MANEIDLVVGSEAFAQITKLLVELGKVDASFTELSAKFAALGSNTNTIKSTADLSKLTAENAKLNSIIEQQIKDYADLNEKLAKSTTIRASTTKEITKEVVAQRELNKETTLGIKAGQGKAETYAQLDARHKIAVKNAQDEAVANGRNTIAYANFVKQANEVGKQLKVIDTDIGKHTRNVGNYSSAWNGLGNSINQLTREAPAFANSVQTGFMALSNNIPILTDELGVLIQKNKDLKADGKPTESILKTVAGAFFSWQTAISLGVTVLTVYGAKLWDMATALTGVEKSQKALNEARVQGMEESSKEISKLDLLYRAATNLDIPQKNRIKNAEKLKELYPIILENISAEEIAVGKAAVKYTELKDAIIASGYASAIRSEIEKINSKFFLEQLSLEMQLENQTKSRLELIEKNKKNFVPGLKPELQAGALSLKVIDKDIKDTNSELNNLSDRRNKETDLMYKMLDKQTKLAAEYEAGKVGVPKTIKTKEDKSAEDAAKKDYETRISNLQRLKEIDKDDLEFSERVIQEKVILSAALAADEILIAEAVFEEKKRLAKGDVQLIQQAANEKLTAEENAQQENLKRVTKYYEEQEKKATEYAKKVSEFNMLDSKEYKKHLEDKKKEDEDRKKYLEKTLDELKNYSESFVSEFASNLGFKETFDFFVKVDSEGKTMWEKLDQDGVSGQEKFKARFNAIAESSQEMFNMIAQMSATNYDQEYARLESQKETSLKFAGDSVAAKEKIEADYEKKKKEIDKRKFEADKKISMVNIAIDTAQAVVAALPNIPLSIIIGAMGAVQLAMVATQQFPAYAEGTDNHKGGLMLVNDGQGSNFQEKVVLPSGKVIRPQGRNVLMNAPKGTKVLNHEQQLFEMLQSNNISMSSQQASGLTYDEMNEIFQKNLGNIKTQNTIFDKNGFQSYVKNGNSITRSNSNRSQAIGISV